MHKSVQNLNIIKNKANEIINRTQQKTNTEVRQKKLKKIKKCFISLSLSLLI